MVIRIADADGLIRSIDKCKWEVAGGLAWIQVYMVAITEGGIACDCPDGANRGGASCKHLMAVEVTLLREAGTIRFGGRPS